MSRKETTSQIKFVENVNSLLDTATDVDTPFDRALENAQTVTEWLGAVHAGKLVVQPPLSHEQYTGFQSRANTIVAIGEKATGALAAAGQSRSAEEKSTGAAKTFEGSGSSSKR